MIMLYDRMPHLLGSNATPDDLLLTAPQQTQLFKGEVWVQEKMDGLAVAITQTSRRRLRWELRPAWQGALDGAIERGLDIYMRQREAALFSLLAPGEILYGEWLWHTITIHYDALPDLFFCYDIRRANDSFATPTQVQRRCHAVGLSTNPPLWQGKAKNFDALRHWVGTSQYGPSRMEGLIVRRTRPTRFPSIAKWVEPDYVKSPVDQLTGQRNSISGSRR